VKGHCSVAAVIPRGRRSLKVKVGVERAQGLRLKPAAKSRQDSSAGFLNGPPAAAPPKGNHRSCDRCHFEAAAAEGETQEPVKVFKAPKDGIKRSDSPEGGTRNNYR
jgi:hypothetical protein